MFKIKEKENKEKLGFEAKQNLLGFFDLLLKSSTPDVLKIFATLFILQNEYFYLACLIFLFLIANGQKLKNLTIKRDSFRIEFLNSKEHKK